MIRVVARKVVDGRRVDKVIDIYDVYELTPTAARKAARTAFQTESGVKVWWPDAVRPGLGWGYRVSPKACTKIHSW